MKTFPWQENGATYFTDPETGERVCTGSQMGRKDFRPADIHAAPETPLALRRVRLNAGGAYWGHGQPLFCGFGHDAKGDAVEFYRRANYRQDAARAIRQAWPAVTFKQGGAL